MKRSYRQHCAVAKALDVVGERWTLLLVRELLLGPRRYKDLLAGLPGIGTNLLAERLRELEAAELVRRRTLPPPAGSTVYELTELGRGLQPMLLELGRWGAGFLADRISTDERRAGWYVVSMLATFRPERAAGLDTTYELDVDGEVFSVEVRGGEVSIGPARSERADLVLRCDLDTFLGLLAGERAARNGGRIELEGPPELLDRFVELFRWPN